MRYDKGFYSTKEWRAFRQQFLTMYPICMVRGCGQPAEVVDHILRRSAGGAALDPTNCQALCVPHHNQKTRLHDQPRRQGGFEWFQFDDTGAPKDPTHPWNS